MLDKDIVEMEEMAADVGNTIDSDACQRLGVSERFIHEWRDGVVLEGAEQADPFFWTITRL